MNRVRVHRLLLTLAAAAVVVAAGPVAWAQDAPPEGFVSLFNGKDLSGWRATLDDPGKILAMTDEERAAAQAAADEEAFAHWGVEDGIIVFDGQGHKSLATARWYEDFELLVDWKCEKGGDSGIYVRGTPQIQIWDWDAEKFPGHLGSGGMWNNQNNPNKPLVGADKPVGEWNTFRIKIIGDRVTVHLNDQLVVDDTVLENYWNREIPLYESGPIELQCHGSRLEFKNIFVREIPRGDGWRDLFNGVDTAGWEVVGGKADGWKAEDGVLYTDGGGGGWLSTTEEFSDFEIEAEFRVPENGNSGIFIRAPREGNPAFAGMEVQVLDDTGSEYTALKPWQYCGGLYSIAAPSRRVSLKPWEWQKMRIRAEGPIVSVWLNGQQIIDKKDVTGPREGAEDHPDHPGVNRTSGYIGFQDHGSRLEYRNIRIRELNK